MPAWNREDSKVESSQEDVEILGLSAIVKIRKTSSMIERRSSLMRLDGTPEAIILYVLVELWMGKSFHGTKIAVQGSVILRYLDRYKQTRSWLGWIDSVLPRIWGRRVTDHWAINLHLLISPSYIRLPARPLLLFKTPCWAWCYFAYLPLIFTPLNSPNLYGCMPLPFV